MEHVLHEEDEVEEENSTQMNFNGLLLYDFSESIAKVCHIRR